MVKDSADIELVRRGVQSSSIPAVEVWILGGDGGYEHELLLDALVAALEPLGFREPPEIGGPLYSHGGEGYLTLFVRDAQHVCLIAWKDWERTVATLWEHGIDCLCARDTNYRIYVSPEDLDEALRVVRSMDGVELHDVHH